MTIKYPLEGGQVRTDKRDHGLARKCYKDNLKLKKKTLHEHPVAKSTLKANLVNLDRLVDLDPRGDPTDDSLTPIGEVKKVHISIESF